MESEGKWVKGGEGRREKGEGLGKSEGMWKEERKRWNESVKENGFCFFVFVSLLHFSPPVKTKVASCSSLFLK